MQDDPTYADVVEDIFEYLHARRDALIAGGLDRQRICLDPGIGFGKTHQHNLTLLAHCARYHDLGCPLLVGHSRKSYIGKVLGDKHADRTAGTIGVALALARQGVQILRVHDVLPVRQALLLFDAAGGIWAD
jgi:dihydropteroate synthase